MITKQEIALYCTQDEDWQKFRLKTLKGKPTEVKLMLLKSWKEERDHKGIEPRRTEVQIENYINALKRGGLLTVDGKIKG